MTRLGTRTHCLRFRCTISRPGHGTCRLRGTDSRKRIHLDERPGADLAEVDRDRGGGGALRARGHLVGHGRVVDVLRERRCAHGPGIVGVADVHERQRDVDAEAQRTACRWLARGPDGFPAEAGSPQEREKKAIRSEARRVRALCHASRIPFVVLGSRVGFFHHGPAYGHQRKND